MPEFNPLLCLDFDGVIHDYRKGWHDGTIYGDVTPGFFEWVERAVDMFKIVVHSSRFKDHAGAATAAHWLAQQAAAASWNLDHVLPQIEWSLTKPPAWVTIDDRAITFTGDWSQVDLVALRAFKPWNATG